MEILEWVGCFAGLCGAALLAWKCKYSGWAFVVYLVSNGAWIAYGLLSHTPGMVVMQIGFTVTSVIGIWNWLIAPRTPRNISTESVGKGVSNA